MKFKTNNPIVFSTATGRIKPTEEKDIDPAAEENKELRIKRETKSRGGKTVSTIYGCPPSQLKAITKKLKGMCACGGSVKDDVIEIQGDHRDKIKVYLEQQGFRVKFSGG